MFARTGSIYRFSLFYTRHVQRGRKRGTSTSGSGYTMAAVPSFTNILLAAAPSSNPTMTINAGTVIRAAAPIVMGVNLENSDSLVTTSQTKTMITAAGLKLFRLGAGSGTDDNQHFNVNSTAVSVGQLVQGVDSVGGVGLVTLDYGCASPQEGAAELADGGAVKEIKP